MADNVVAGRDHQQFGVILFSSGSLRSSEFAVILMFFLLSFVCQIRWLLDKGPGSSCRAGLAAGSPHGARRADGANLEAGRHIDVMIVSLA